LLGGNSKGDVALNGLTQVAPTGDLGSRLDPSPTNSFANSCGAFLRSLSLRLTLLWHVGERMSSLPCAAMRAASLADNWELIFVKPHCSCNTEDLVREITPLSPAQDVGDVAVE